MSRAVSMCVCVGTLVEEIREAGGRRRSERDGHTHTHCRLGYSLFTVYGTNTAVA